MTVIAQRLAFLGNPLEWSAVDKGILISAMMVPMQLLYILYCVCVLRFAVDGEVFDFEQLRVHIQYLTGFAVVGVATCVVGVWLRQRNPESNLFQHLAAQVYAVSMCIVGYRIGIMSMVVGVVITGAPFACYIFFNRQTVYAATASSVLLICGFAYAGAVGVLPYAPVLVPEVGGGEQSSVWVLSMLLVFVAPQLIWFYAMGMYVVYRWRLREREVQLLSVRDPLTGVANRRHIMDELEREVTRSTRDGLSLSVIMVDLDHFKRINDQYGHHAGDQVLRTAASILADAVRQTDTLGRFGGEEFLILLPNTDLSAAREVAERCREQLRAVTIVVAGKHLTISGSFGVGNYANWDAPVPGDRIVQWADEALYQAKNSGRNRVVVS